MAGFTRPLIHLLVSAPMVIAPTSMRAEPSHDYIGVMGSAASWSCESIGQGGSSSFYSACVPTQSLSVGVSAGRFVSKQVAPNELCSAATAVYHPTR
jgi:hypothetical protein